jgi:uracil-DNA glycosylase family 4
MSTGRALQQVLQSWQSAGLGHLPKLAVSATEPSPAPAVAATVPVAPSPPQDTVPDMARKQAAAARPELPVIGVAPEIKMSGSREERLAALQARVAKCTRCQELATTRTQTVFGVGNPKARVMFIGEAPGADEDAQGEPFIGRAGQLLTKIIQACGWTREELYICNILRCRPPGNRTPSTEEANHCREYLDGQIAIIQPEYIVCWGTCAAQNLLASEETIGKMRGRFYTHGKAKVLCTYHPSYLLRNPEAKKPVWEDMKLLLGEMGLKIPEQK